MFMQFTGQASPSDGVGAILIHARATSHTHPRIQSELSHTHTSYFLPPVEKEIKIIK